MSCVILALHALVIGGSFVGYALMICIVAFKRLIKFAARYILIELIDIKRVVGNFGLTIARRPCLNGDACEFSDCRA